MSSSRKIVVVTGKTNVDSLDVDKEKRIRVNAIDKELDIEQALSMLTVLKEGGEGDYCEEGRKAIESKINGYKQQDIKKDVFDAVTLISLEEVLDKLITCSLTCNYCDKRVKILYRQVRDPMQWTLDRIDNDSNHSCNNTVVSCLSCNLKRRLTDKEKFEFTKRMKIVKVN
tara:strand:- start:2499 stop:3011 length:513 start_codon:yes stop_codon:yes gene_type:complete